MVDDQTSTATVDSNFEKLETDLADRIRIGRTFYAPDERYGIARYACAQVYDMPMSYDEMRELKTGCSAIKESFDGAPSGLVMMHPFNDQHKCRSIEPLGQQQGLENHECVLVTGPRYRESEALRITKATMNAAQVLLTPVTTNSDYESELTDTSSFTLMMYIKLRTADGMSCYALHCESLSRGSDSWISLTLPRWWVTHNLGFGMHN